MSPVRGRRFRPSLGVVAVASIGVGQLAASAVAGSEVLSGSSGALLIVVAVVVVAPVVAGGLMWLDAAVVSCERLRGRAPGAPAPRTEPGRDAEVVSSHEFAPGRVAGARVVAHAGHQLSQSDEPRRRVPTVDPGIRPSAATAD